MPHIEDVLLESLGQTGDAYVFGAKGHPLDPDPDAFDCSGLVKWACDRADVRPEVPHGAFYQWGHVKVLGRELPVEQALHTRGALLFAGTGVGVGRQAITHVAWSLGDRTTIEARGSKWGVGTWSAAGRFTFAGLLPGIDYTPRPPWREEDFMQTFDVVIPAGGGKATFVGLDGKNHPIAHGSVVNILPSTVTPEKTLDGDAALWLPEGRYTVVTHA
ncbi:MAG: C40 family peptidase [Acidimicrobiia bacterium]